MPKSKWCLLNKGKQKLHQIINQPSHYTSANNPKCYRGDNLLKKYRKVDPMVESITKPDEILKEIN